MIEILAITAILAAVASDQQRQTPESPPPRPPLPPHSAGPPQVHPSSSPYSGLMDDVLGLGGDELLASATKANP